MKTQVPFGSAVACVIVVLTLMASASYLAQDSRESDPKVKERQAIFLAAKDLFLNRGYAATSMADIAKAADVDAKTLMSHFATKADIEKEVLDWWHKVELDNFRKWIADARKVSDDPLEQTLAFIKNFENFAIRYAEDAKQPPPGEIWAAFIYDHHNQSEAVRARIARDMRSWEALQEEQFQTIYKSRKPRIDVTTKDLAQSLMSMIEGTVILGRSWYDRHLMTRRIRQFRQTLTVLFDDKLESTDPSAIASLPSGSIQRIAFGSCAKHWQHQPIWKTIIEQNPDLFLFLGDAIYSDTDGVTAWNVTEKQLQGEWNRLADKPEFQRFRSQVPIMATWDNHDYGTHNGGAEFELKEASKRIFLDFFGEPKESARRKRAGLYDAKIFGPECKRVQIILLDTRTFRGPFKSDPRDKGQRAKIGKVGKYIPHDNPNVPFLGETQWQWLESELRKPADVRLVCSSTQIIPNTKGMDEWGCYPHSRTRLFELIEKTKASGVIMLSGNVHFAEISKTQAKAYPLLEFTSSGMTHIDLEYAQADNPSRLAGPMTELNFGFIEIDWSAKPATRIALKAIGLDSEVEFEHLVPLDLLQKNTEQ